MSEIAKMLRLLVQADKEFKVTSIPVYGAASKFTSRLTSGYLRKGFAVYNNSNSASGEVVWGGATDTGIGNKGMPISKGTLVNIPVASSLDIYFSNTVSGELSDLRILELA